METARLADDEIIHTDIDLEELGEDLQTKIDNIVEYLYRNEALAKGLKERADEFAKKAKAIENHNERLK